jgi:putative PIN family toxin of toxin-antitoxin system
VKVFLDTNVLISAFTTRGLSADLLRLILAEHELMTGEVNLVEFRRVLQVLFGVPDDEIRFAEALLHEQTVVPEPEELPEFPIRDPDDLWVLASALLGHADLLVTGDKDLLTVAAEAPVRILSPRACWEELRQRA